MVDIGDEQIFLHLQHALNAAYASTTSAENFLKVIGKFLNDKITTVVLVARDFTLLSDESTDERESLRMFVYVRFVDAQTRKPVERFLGKLVERFLGIVHLKKLSIYMMLLLVYLCRKAFTGL